MKTNLICLCLGHKYRVTQELAPGFRRIGCTRCGLAFAMDDYSQMLVPWDADFHRMYERHGIKIKYQQWEFNTASIAKLKA